MSYKLLECLNPQFWEYKAEGFDSIILSWVGPSDSPFYLKALRLFKDQNDGFRRGNAPSVTDFTDRIVMFQRYIDTFIRPYLPEVDHGTPYSVTQEFNEQIAAKIHPKRPKKRIKESHLCVTSKVALLHDDHIPPNSLVIELKPKWGFLADCPLIDPNSPKLTVSRFQMAQRQKLKKGEIKSYTRYDPLDLFSGTKDRVKKAVLALIENPQGNLKVFRDKKSSNLEEKEIDQLVDLLFRLPALKKLLAMQRLDVWDIECIEPIIKKAGENLTWAELAHEKSVIDGVRKMIDDGFVLPKSKEKAKNIRDNLTKDEARAFVAAFCISQAAKDCSFMILSESGKLENPKIYLIDFDLKMPEILISNYLKHDKGIVATYIEVESSK